MLMDSKSNSGSSDGEGLGLGLLFARAADGHTKSSEKNLELTCKAQDEMI